MREWQHETKFKGKVFIGRYGLLNGDRVFQLIPVDGLGGIKSFESWQQAKKQGWMKL